MKKIVLTLAIVFGGLISAQDYYDTYPSEYNGYEYYDNSYDYPDDYYYNYPTDYYPDQYYQGYYSDYRNAVYGVNWDQFFVQYRLTPYQINQVMMLNNRFASYGVWNSYYRYNPDRWYYDRFYALQNILGPRVFVVYQNVYFRGASPFVYYRNRCANFYARRYPVRPVYRNVNINVYKVNRGNFKEGFRSVGRNQGMMDTNRNNGLRKEPLRSGSDGRISGGTRNPQNGGVRNDNSTRSNQDNGQINQGGFRNGNNNTGYSQPNINSGGNRGQNNGIRPNQNSERTIENRGSNQRNTSPNSQNNGRSSGMRLTSN
ncbi:hypothetical protein [Epilithonimonas tenax]|uniref:hypothetical protein n=1 Tax=Epilithonimonas tenax TaxID=191577 RepID=UPI00040D54FE|nr:hypothetical protein [Epilithonimonas tenax]